MKTVSWILLTVVALLMMLGGAGSSLVAYFAPASNDIIVGPTTLDDLNLDEEVAKALRGRRGTAGAYAISLGCLLLWVILGPYRRGEKWAWWAIFCTSVVLTFTLILRVPSLGIKQGAMIGVWLLIAVVIGLLLDVRRLSAQPKED